jgi:hypothetical protein
MVHEGLEMSHLLSEPGFWEIDADDYHRDPCVEPSLSNSVGQILLERCPRAAWWAHPRLNPQFAEDNETKFDRGTVAHALLLGKGRPMRVIDAPDFRTKAAQLERDAYREAGFTPILAHHHAGAMAMVVAARQQLKDVEGGQFALNPEFGDIELCAINRDPVGIWTRTLIDFYGAKVPDGVTCWDYKTTAGTANPAMLSARMDDAWAFQAAFQERIITTLKPGLAGLIKFKFLVQENEEPYMCSVVEPTSAARTIAHKQVAAACVIWKACSDRRAWPGYPRSAVPIGGTPWKEAAWLSRELNDEMVQLAANDPFLMQVFQTGSANRAPGWSTEVGHWPAGVTLGVDPGRTDADHTVETIENGQVTGARVRKPRGPYKPRKPKAPSAPPDGMTNMDAG